MQDVRIRPPPPRWHLSPNTICVSTNSRHFTVDAGSGISMDSIAGRAGRTLRRFLRRRTSHDTRLRPTDPVVPVLFDASYGDQVGDVPRILLQESCSRDPGPEILVQQSRSRCLIPGIILQDSCRSRISPRFTSAALSGPYFVARFLDQDSYCRNPAEEILRKGSC